MPLLILIGLVSFLFFPAIFTALLWIVGAGIAIWLAIVLWPITLAILIYLIASGVIPV